MPELTLTTIMTVLAFIALAGGAAGYFKAARGDSIIKYHEKEGALKDATITRQDKEIVALKAENHALVEAKERLQENVVFLQDLAQGSPQLKSLAKAVKNQTSIITKFFEKARTS